MPARALLLACLLPATAGAETRGVEVELLASVRSLAPSATFTVGLRLRHAAGFHTYWRNPGVVGYATRLEWKLPEGFTAGPVRWPVPEHSDMAGHPVFGYETDAILLVDLKAPARLDASSVTLEATASWMACAAECHPGEKTFQLTLPIGGRPEPAHAELFQAAEARIPRPLDGWRASLTSAPGAGNIALEITPPEGVEIPADLDLFPADGQVSSVPAPRLERTAGGTLTLETPRSRFSPKGKPTLPFVLVSKSPLNAAGQRFGTLEPSYP